MLASYHAQIAGGAGYEMEDKLAFLQKCEAVGLPPSPWLKLPAKIICKHRNEVRVRVRVRGRGRGYGQD